MLEHLKNVGFVQQVTDEKAFIAANPKKAYIGFDLTADCLHVGSLIQIMALRNWIERGGEAYALLGTATTIVGDPSGKTEARQMLDDETIHRNYKSISRLIQRLLPKAHIIANDWHLDGSHIDWLKAYGPHFNMARMLSMDSVKSRLESEQSMTLLEFNYMTLQAIDFVWLKEGLDISVQIGGSDQWGNITIGIDLYKKLKGENYKMALNERIFGITTPLLLNKDGSKMGKSVNGAIWLDPDRIERDKFWHFWRNTRDEQVALFLGLFTECGERVLEEARQAQGAEFNDFKILLADEVTNFIFGD